MHREGIYLFTLFVQLPFSSLSCAGSSWLPLPLVSFFSFSLLPFPDRLCQSERSPEARHEADSFEPAKRSERLTPGQSGWLGAAAIGSIPALALSLFLQHAHTHTHTHMQTLAVALSILLSISDLQLKLMVSQLNLHVTTIHLPPMKRFQTNLLWPMF